MKRFSQPGLLMITLFGGIVSAQLWQRRKLKRLARRISYEGQLMHAAIRITNEVRGSLDIPRMLETTASEVAHALDIEHCCITFAGDNLNPSSFACSCGKREHDCNTEATFTSALNTLRDGCADRFLSHNYQSQPDSDSEPTTFPVLGIPMTRDGDGLEGTLLVLSHNPERLWLESEVQMLLAVAHQLSLSVNYARLFASKERESLTDPLTSCLNRRGFDMQFESHLGAAKASDTPISLLMIDLDFFKAINDSYGHPTGDSVLRMVAGILFEERVGGAITARVGGEEFALLLPGHSVEQSTVVAERVRRRVEVMTIPEVSSSITVSCGIASFPTHALTRDSLYAMADRALIRAKTSGRNCVCVF